MKGSFDNISIIQNSDEDRTVVISAHQNNRSFSTELKGTDIDAMIENNTFHQRL
ncbi:hypothetical protein [Mucilaginibacter galii]|uniref:hypothetical protein n=1 Tax=Mucilaginibacter galii TaxID=2005073 RepID=UPI00166CA94C|nr:hypothetical protein [Mucilaginibacter galii]